MWHEILENFSQNFESLPVRDFFCDGPRLGVSLLSLADEKLINYLRRSAVRQSISTALSWNQHIEVSVLILLDGPPSSLRLINLKRPPWSRSYLEVLITIKTNMVHLMLLNGSPAIMCVLFITNFLVGCLFKYCMLCIYTRYNLALHRNVRETKT